MKTMMISVHPEWVQKILNGDKTIEVRPWKPKGELPLEVLIYCTKDKKHKLEYCDYNGGYWSANDGGEYFNGKVVAKFTLNKVEEIKTHTITTTNTYGVKRIEITNDTQSLNKSQLLKLSCLNNYQLNNYLDTIWWNGKAHICGYAWKIDDLKIFEEPKELWEFYHYKKKLIDCGMDCPPYIDEVKVPLTKAPQKMVWVED